MKQRSPRCSGATSDLVHRYKPFLSIALASVLLSGCSASVSPQGVVGTAGRSSSLAIVRSQTNCPASPRGSGLLPDGDFSQAQQPSGNSEYGLPEGTKFAPS